jgi:DNA-binding transcriptional ArsR family regulator
MVFMDKFSALADPNRRKIVELLATKGTLSATEIYEHFKVSPQAISQHLKVLRQAGLVQVEKQAQKRIYRVNLDAMYELEGWARKIRQLWADRFDALEKLVQAEKNRLKEESDE